MIPAWQYLNFLTYMDCRNENGFEVARMLTSDKNSIVPLNTSTWSLSTKNKSFST